MTNPGTAGTVHTPAPAVAGALEQARERWGLDAAPVSSAIPVNPQLKPEAKRRVRAILNRMGTPLDVVRGMLAKAVPPEWERALREISPQTDTASYLVFAWKEPLLEPDAGRWCLYEAIPDPLISVERRMELAGTPYWERPKAERGAQAQIVSAYQWEMYRRHRVDVRPFWCLQGTEGGTPLHHSVIERRYLRMMRKPEDPAPVGALPYAPWDARVRRAVLERDRLVKFGGSVARLRQSATAEEMRAALEQEERAYRRLFWDWFSEKLAPQSELLAYVFAHEDPDRVRQTAEDAAAAAEARDHFIEFGRVPDPAMYRKRRLLVPT